MKHWGKRLLTAVLLLAACIVPALADAAVEDYWNYAYAVDYDCYVASPDGVGLNFRYGPGAEYDKIFADPIPMHTKLHIETETTSTKGAKWGYTAYGGEWGWVYLTETTTTKPAAAADDYWSRATQTNYIAYVASPDGVGLNLRSGPDSSYGKVRDTPIPMDAALTITYETTSVKHSKWGYTKYDGVEGWVYLAETTTAKPAAAPAAPTAPPDATDDPADSTDPAADAAVPSDDATQPAEDGQTAAPTLYTPLTLAIIAIIVLAVAVTALLLLLLRKNRKGS